MVSGLVTSPCDQLRIFSGDARLMRIASKSAIVFCISNGLERNKVFLRFLLSSSGQGSVTSGQFFMFRGGREPLPRETFLQKVFGGAATPSVPYWPLITGHCLIRCRAGRGLLLPGLDQLHIEAERLQFADQHVERLRYARLHGSFAVYDGLVNLGSAVNVVGLRRQQFLQNECRSVSFERPDFHFSETLSAELRLAAQWLLGD